MFRQNKIFILGMARSGYEVAKLLAIRENNIVLNDMKKDHDSDKVKELNELGVKTIFGEHPDDLLDSTFDYLIKNPGVPIDHKYVLMAEKLGVEVINEVEVAYRLLPKEVTLIGITGTNGKTTTTTLIYEMIKKSGKRVHLTGNIGFPLCGFLDKIENDDIIVMETSCQQLQNLTQFNPSIAVMTNLSEAHVDFFKSYEKYKEVKAKIFQNHTRDNIAILNIENDDVLNVTKNVKSTTKYFSSKKEINGCYIKDGSIYYYDEKIIDLADIKLIGYHNYENVMAAIMVVKELGIENESIVSLLKEFGGVEHRIEFVREINNVKFYNDSKATNIKATQIALSSFKQPVILLLGGMERGQNFNELNDYMSYVKHVVTYGECKKRIEEFANSLNISVEVVDILEDAIKISNQLATSGDVVLLSPAAASWDQYKSFEERGEVFKKVVSQL